MKINKRKMDFLLLLERSGGMFRSELPESKYPASMINSLVDSGLVNEYKEKLTSATSPAGGGDE